MNQEQFENEYDEVGSEFSETWAKPAHHILSEWRYGPFDFLETFESEGYELIQGLIDSGLNDPTDETDEDIMIKRIDDFFIAVEAEKRKRKMKAIL